MNEHAYKTPWCYIPDGRLVDRAKLAADLRAEGQFELAEMVDGDDHSD